MARRKKTACGGRHGRSGGTAAAAGQEEQGNSGTSDAFTAIVRESAQQLPRAVERLLEGPATLKEATYLDISKHINVLIDYSLEDIDDGGTARSVTLLRDGSLQLALLQLTAVTSRFSLEEASGLPRDTSQGDKTFVELTSSLVAFLLGQATSSAVEFALKLLRMHTLQAFSRQLAATAELLLGSTTSSVGQLSMALSFAENALMIIQSLIYALEEQGELGPSSDQTSLHQHAPNMQFRNELASNLVDSSVLDHISRVLLLVQLNHGMSDGSNDELDGALRMPTTLLNRVLLRIYYSTPQFQAALSGRCVQQAAIVLGLSALCAADDGPSYGLPSELMRGVPLLLAPGEGDSCCSCCGVVINECSSRPSYLNDDVFFGVLAALDAESAPTWISRRAALTLLLRIGRLVVASGQLHATGVSGGATGDSGHGGSSSSGGRTDGGSSSSTASGSEGSRVRRLVLRQGDLAGLALLVLDRAEKLRALHPQPEGSASWAAEAGEWWRLLVEVIRYTVQGAEQSQQSALGAMLMRSLAGASVAFFNGTTPLPPSLPPPPPELAAALSAGVLPCLERLLRRTGRDLLSPEASVLYDMDSSAYSRTVTSLFAYGDLRQATALITTLAKILRLDPRVVIESGSSMHRAADALAGSRV
ncbi:hypothetical protein Agub_g9764, partial [Astrephomene gubernaculifera]